MKRGMEVVAKNWWFYMLFHHTLIIHKQTVLLSPVFIIFVLPFSFPIFMSTFISGTLGGRRRRLRDGKHTKNKRKIFSLIGEFSLLFYYVFLCVELLLVREWKDVENEWFSKALTWKPIFTWIELLIFIISIFII